MLFLFAVAFVVQHVDEEIFMKNKGWMTAAVGQGHFTVEEDRRLVGSAIQKMVQRKMLSYLARVDLDSFRMMFNLQRVHFRNLPVKPVDDVVPGFISNSQDPAAAAVASFFYQNGFHSISQRNSGFSPMCFAALDGRPLLLAALLEQRADVNDRVSGEAGPPFANCPLLHVCSYLSHNEAIRFLINHGADVKAKDGYGATALPWAAFSDNVEGIRVLIAAGCDPKEADMLGYAAGRLKQAMCIYVLSYAFCLLGREETIPHSTAPASGSMACRRQPLKCGCLPGRLFLFVHVDKATFYLAVQASIVDVALREPRFLSFWPVLRAPLRR